MVSRAGQESPLSSQSSLSGPPSENGRQGGVSAKRSTRGTRIIKDSEERSDVGDEVDDDLSDKDEDGGDEEDELDDDDDDNQGEGQASRPKRRVAVAAAAARASKSKRGREVPARSAAIASTKRTSKAQQQQIVSSDEDEEEEEKEEEDEEEEDELEDDDEDEEDQISGSDNGKIVTPQSRSKRITLRFSAKKQVASKTKKPAARGRQSNASKASSRRAKNYDDLSDDDEEEVEAVENSNEDDSEDFANDNSFASLPKTARQLAKERAAQGIETPDSALADPESSVTGKSTQEQKMTESELALKRSEMARRRRNQTEKKLEDDKIETINKLLKKQVSRRGTRGGRGGEDSEGEPDEDGENRAGNDKLGRTTGSLNSLQRKEQPQPFFRYIQRADGLSSLSVPIEASDAAITPYKRKWDEMFPVRAERAA